MPGIITRSGSSWRKVGHAAANPQLPRTELLIVLQGIPFDTVFQRLLVWVLFYGPKGVVRMVLLRWGMIPIGNSLNHEV